MRSPSSGFALPILLAAASLAAASLAPAAFAYEPLTDVELDAITAGTADETVEEFAVSAAHRSASGKLVTVDGTLGVQKAQGALADADLLLRDSAQSHLNALVNLNAVQSVVNVLVNLNINIDSHVGELRQINLTSGAGR